MKIKATKKELAGLVRSCVNGSSCMNCVLQEYCGGSTENEIEDFVEIEEKSKECDLIIEGEANGKR